MSKRVVLGPVPSTSGYHEEFRVLFIKDGLLKENEVIELEINREVRVKSDGLIVWYTHPHTGILTADVCETSEAARESRNFWDARGGRCFITPRLTLE